MINMNLKNKSEDKCKTFLGILFDIDKSNDVIPKLWVSKWGDRLVCKYPPINCDIRTLSERQTPVSTGWKEYKCKILCDASKY